MVVKNHSEFPGWINYQLIPSDFGCFNGRKLFHINNDKLFLKLNKPIKKIYASSCKYSIERNNTNIKLNSDYYRSNYGSAYVPDNIVCDAFNEQINSSYHDNIFKKNILSLYKPDTDLESIYLIAASGTHCNELSFYNINNDNNDIQCNQLMNHHKLKFKNRINQITNVISQNRKSVVGVKLDSKVLYIDFNILPDDKIQTKILSTYKNPQSLINSSYINEYDINEAVITENNGKIKLFNINRQSCNNLMDTTEYKFNDCTYMNHPKLLLYTNDKSINLLDTRISEGYNSSLVSNLNEDQNFIISKPHPKSIENVYSVTEDTIMLHDIRYSKQSLLSINHNSKDYLPYELEIVPFYHPTLFSDIIYLWNPYTGINAFNIIHPYFYDDNNEIQKSAPYMNIYNYSIESFYDKEYFTTKELLEKKTYVSVNSEDVVRYPSPLKGFATYSTEIKSNINEIHIFQLSDRGNIYYSSNLLKYKSNQSTDINNSSIELLHFNSLIKDKESNISKSISQTTLINDNSMDIINQNNLINSEVLDDESNQTVIGNNNFETQTSNNNNNNNNNSHNNNNSNNNKMDDKKVAGMNNLIENLNEIFLSKDIDSYTNISSLNNTNLMDVDNTNENYNNLQLNNSNPTLTSSLPTPSNVISISTPNSEIMNLYSEKTLNNSIISDNTNSDTIKINNPSIDSNKNDNNNINVTNLFDDNSIINSTNDILNENKTKLKRSYNEIDDDEVYNRDRVAYSSYDYSSLYQYITKDTMLPKDIESTHGFINYFNSDVIQNEIKGSIQLMTNNVMVKSLNEIHQRLSDNGNQYSKGKIIKELPNQNLNGNIDWTNKLFRKEFSRGIKRKFKEEEIIKLRPRFLPYRECQDDLFNFYKLRESLDTILPSKATYNTQEGPYDEKGEISNHDAVKNFIAYSIWSAARVCNLNYKPTITHESIYRMINDYIQEMNIHNQEDLLENEKDREEDTDRTYKKNVMVTEDISEEFKNIIEAFDEYKESFTQYRIAKLKVKEKEQELGIDLGSGSFSEETLDKIFMNKYKSKNLLKPKSIIKEKAKLQKKWQKILETEIKIIKEYDQEVLTFVKNKLYVSKLSPYVIPISQQTKILLNHYENEDLVTRKNVEREKKRESINKYKHKSKRSKIEQEGNNPPNENDDNESIAMEMLEYDQNNPWAYLDDIDLNHLSDYNSDREDDEQDDFLSYIQSIEDLEKEEEEERKEKIEIENENENENKLFEIFKTKENNENSIKIHNDGNNNNNNVNNKINNNINNNINNKENEDESDEDFPFKSKSSFFISSVQNSSQDNKIDENKNNCEKKNSILINNINKVDKMEITLENKDEAENLPIKEKLVEKEKEIVNKNENTNSNANVNVNVNTNINENKYENKNINDTLTKTNENDSVNDTITKTNENESINDTVIKTSENENISDTITKNNENENINDTITKNNENENINNNITKLNENERYEEININDTITETNENESINDTMIKNNDNENISDTITKNSENKNINDTITKNNENENKYEGKNKNDTVIKNNENESINDTITKNNENENINDTIIKINEDGNEYEDENINNTITNNNENENINDTITKINENENKHEGENINDIITKNNENENINDTITKINENENKYENENINDTINKNNEDENINKTIIKNIENNKTDIIMENKEKVETLNINEKLTEKEKVNIIENTNENENENINNILIQNSENENKNDNISINKFSNEIGKFIEVLNSNAQNNKKEIDNNPNDIDNNDNNISNNNNNSNNIEDIIIQYDDKDHLTPSINEHDLNKEEIIDQNIIKQKDNNNNNNELENKKVKEKEKSEIENNNNYDNINGISSNSDNVENNTVNNGIEKKNEDDSTKDKKSLSVTHFNHISNIFNTEKYYQLLMQHPSLSNIHINTHYLSYLFDISLLGMNFFDINKKSKIHSKHHRSSSSSSYTELNEIFNNNSNIKLHSHTNSSFDIHHLFNSNSSYETSNSNNNNNNSNHNNSGSGSGSGSSSSNNNNNNNNNILFTSSKLFFRTIIFHEQFQF